MILKIKQIGSIAKGRRKEIGKKDKSAHLTFQTIYFLFNTMKCNLTLHVLFINFIQ